MARRNSKPALCAGVARRIITPQRPIFQSGYSRDAKSEGVYQQLYARALVLQDARQTRIAILTAELLDFSPWLVETIKNGVARKLGLQSSQVLLSASHTHCGPALDDGLAHLYAEIDQPYSRWLADECVAVICEAARRPVPVTARFATGRAAFGINRRRPDFPDCPMEPNPEGRHDPDVAILKLTTEAGAPVAILFSYACHPTTMGGQLIGGDYPGQAQLQLEMAFPGANAMFLAGCFGDIRPRMIHANGKFTAGTIEDVRMLGRDLALAVLAGLAGPPRDITGSLYHHLETVQLPYQKRPTVAELQKRRAGSDKWEAGWIERMLKRLQQGERLPSTRPATVQAFGIGPFRLIAFNDEMCVGYQIALKRRLAPAPVLVSAYCGISRAYVPTADLIPEGGYEVIGSNWIYNEPAPLAPRTERILLAAALRLARG